MNVEVLGGTGFHISVFSFIHQGAVIIHEVNDGGAAQRDGRLQAGDQILEVLWEHTNIQHHLEHDEAESVAFLDVNANMLLLEGTKYYIIV